MRISGEAEGARIERRTPEVALEAIDADERLLLLGQVRRRERRGRRRRAALRLAHPGREAALRRRSDVGKNDRARSAQKSVVCPFLAAPELLGAMEEKRALLALSLVLVALASLAAAYE